MEFKRPLVALAALCLLSGTAQVAYAAGEPGEVSPSPVDTASAAPTSPNPDDPPASDPGVTVFDTATSPFVPDTPNQGWWGENQDNYALNANYAVGADCNKGEIRDFFTFDLRSLTEEVTSASLRINTGRIVGDDLEILRFYDVSTDPQTLNARQGQDASIFADLGTGEVFGTYRLSSQQDDQVMELKLNYRGLRALNEARGGFFSIGGRLISLGVRGPGVEEQYAFADSSRAETVQLLTQTSGS